MKAFLLLALLVPNVGIFAQGILKRSPLRNPPDSASLEIGRGVEEDDLEEKIDDHDEEQEAFKPAQPMHIIPTDIQDLRSPVWKLKNFRLTCCLGGTPVVTSQDQQTRNFTYQLHNYVIDEQVQVGDVGSVVETSGDSATTLNCRIFHGSYEYASTNTDSEYGPRNPSVQVTCHCPEIGGAHVLDKNCRKLPSCKNNGFRSETDPRKCLCVQPFFGSHCERFCDQGQRLRGLNGRDYCSCSPFYRGIECRELICLNGGHEQNGRCICPAQFLGYHCEIDTNRTGPHSEFHGNTNSRFQRFGDQNNEMFTRDISGTIFSLIMIVVLVVSMYLLMKHRMQVQTRYLSRRPDLLGACNFPIVPPGNGMTTRRVELMPTLEDQSRSFPFRSIMTSIVGDGGPPPYIPPGHRGRRTRDDSLPPLPSYEDATKLPPLRHNVGEEEESNEEPVASPEPVIATLEEEERRPSPVRRTVADELANMGSAYSEPCSSSSSSSSSHSTPVHRHRQVNTEDEDQAPRRPSSNGTPLRAFPSSTPQEQTSRQAPEEEGPCRHTSV